MGFGKFLACVVGGAVAVVAAPIVLPAAAAVGGAVAAGAAAAGAAVTGAAGAAAAAVGSTAVGSAIAGAGTAVAGAVGTAATAVGSTAVGTAITGAATGLATTAAGAVTSTVAAVGSTGVAAAIGAATTYSAATTGEGFMNKAEAEEIIASARRRYKKKKDDLDKKMKSSNDKMMKLNEYKMKVYATTIKESVNLISKITVPKEKHIDFLDKKKVVFLPNDAELVQMKKFSEEAVEVVKQMANGASFVKSAASGSLAFMSQFGIASTGTAIANLSGAAATNATLAALGGGALTAGGGGMALGSSVLGGLTILPAAMMMSWQYAKESEKALTEAKKYHSKLEKEISKIGAIEVFLREGLNPRVDEIYTTIEKLVESYEKTVLNDLRTIIQNKADSTGKVHYNECSPEQQKKIQLAAYFTRKIKELLAVKPLDQDGNLNLETKTFLDELNSDKQIQGVVKIV
jgi:hypothetical protein